MEERTPAYHVRGICLKSIPGKSGLEGGEDFKSVPGKFETEGGIDVSTELIAIISVGVTIIGVILNGQRIQQKSMDGLRQEVSGLREEVNGLRERIAYLEGLLEGLREAITGRRPVVTEAVAEDPGPYGKR